MPAIGGLQVPVVAFRGEVPEWWIWQTHDATELEETLSSWPEVLAIFRRGSLIYEGFPGF